ncbi:2-hydroxychromene-2-carboxylate isomerase [Stappia sp. GBMRC 2046]|uniref:2-hydroxychromene-2-carboxylate isomerase n=1 Tax=Stappia sediminis TaxID=2692190 RepID=A0A7X3LVK2_9HYPH|nr:2-hydroxychromene-2-carboxylate isomerase [Stappia sediminis]MXN65914.1 2-hydroxychromene-2-carboxylate isomerase [Stappia sediminis]
MQRVIDYYFTQVSPWAYIGHQAFLKLADEYGYAVRFKPVNLGQVFAETGGLPLGKRHPARQAYRLLDLQRWREKRDLPLNLHPKHFPTNAGLADRVVIVLAREGGPISAFSDRVFRACWAEERDIAERDVLKAILDDLGVDGEQILTAADGSEIAERYEAHRQEAVEAGVFGSPSYVWKGEVFWGQDSLELLEDALKSDREPYSAE